MRGRVGAIGDGEDLKGIFFSRARGSVFWGKGVFDDFCEWGRGERRGTVIAGVVGGASASARVGIDFIGAYLYGK